MFNVSSLTNQSKYKMQTNIVINFQVEGLHNWPDARVKHPTVGFLSELHRHQFHFTVKKRVSHSDRDIEIILFKREIQGFIINSFYNTDLGLCNFGSRSCEELATNMVTTFNLEYCQVLEDNENGAEVWK